MPVARQYMDVEKTNAAVADAHRLGRPAVDVFAMEEVFLELGFGDEIGRFVVELREHTDRAGVGFLSRFSFPIELQGCNHALIPIVHKVLLPKKDRRALSKNDGGGTGIEGQDGLTAA